MHSHKGLALECCLKEAVNFGSNCLGGSKYGKEVHVKKWLGSPQKVPRTLAPHSGNPFAHGFLIKLPYSLKNRGPSLLYSCTIITFGDAPVHQHWSEGTGALSCLKVDAERIKIIKVKRRGHVLSNKHRSIDSLAHIQEDQQLNKNIIQATLVFINAKEAFLGNRSGIYVAADSIRLQYGWYTNICIRLGEVVEEFKGCTSQHEN
mmetsp:Transcript_5095/g.8359  ORF Transcript_5095/g.8359 Transcript_5095/m.8359 type:complete len:205 (-) Transcript_5095:230-844(-)